MHDLLLIIVSNRKFQFISIVWKIFCKKWSIIFKFSTVFHFETNESFEIINQKIKRYLRIFCNHHQDNWFEILSMTKFVANKCHSTSIEVFSFMVTKKIQFAYELWRSRFFDKHYSKTHFETQSCRYFKKNEWN